VAECLLGAPAGDGRVPSEPEESSDEDDDDEDSSSILSEDG